MSTIYRFWAAVRLREMMDWQEQWIHPAQHGARTAHGTEDVFWALALRVEHALLTGEPLYGTELDYKKCFDSLPQAVLLQLAAELGLYARVLRLLEAMYARLRRRFVFGGAVGSELQATNVK